MFRRLGILLDLHGVRLSILGLRAALLCDRLSRYCTFACVQFSRCLCFPWELAGDSAGWVYMLNPTRFLSRISKLHVDSSGEYSRDRRTDLRATFRSRAPGVLNERVQTEGCAGTGSKEWNDSHRNFVDLFVRFNSRVSPLRFR